LKSLIINHPSIWADKTQTDQDEQMFQLFGTTDKSGMISNDQLKLLKNQYTMGTFANAVLYEKPILT
jgi:hypothetical protein